MLGADHHISEFDVEKRLLLIFVVRDPELQIFTTYITDPNFAGKRIHSLPRPLARHRRHPVYLVRSEESPFPLKKFLPIPSPD